MARKHRHHHGKHKEGDGEGRSKKSEHEHGDNKHHHHHHSSSSKGDVDLQSWSEIPSIAHFCSLFRQAFDLLEFDIQELEESLLLMGSPGGGGASDSAGGDDGDESQLVLRLLIKLLKGCSKTFTNNINEDNYNTYLRRLFLSKREEAEEDNFEFGGGAGTNNLFECKALLDDDIDFPDLSLRNRVRILQQLTEYRLDAEDVFDKVKNLEANSLRVDPLGKDSDNVTYWYFYGTRLYKEEGKSEKKSKKEKEKERKKKKKEKKKKKKSKKSRRESTTTTTTEDDEEESSSNKAPKWSVACLTLQDWEDLAAKYKKSKKRSDKELYETIHDNFLPEIVKMFAEQEREERRKLLELQPKRASSRIERKRRDQELKDRLLAEKLEEERRLEEEYDDKVREERMKREEEERERAREERIKQRDANKEMRAQRAAERQCQDLEVQKSSKRQQLKHQQVQDEDDEDEDADAILEGRKRKKRRKREKYDDLYNPFSGDNDHDSDEDYAPSKDEILAAANAAAAANASKENNKGGSSAGAGTSSSSAASSPMHFTNALLKVGSKSFKDVNLDKPVRKMPGLLLETAGQSLLQRRSGGSLASAVAAANATSPEDRKFNSLLLNSGGADGDQGRRRPSGAGGIGGSLSRPGGGGGGLSFGLVPDKISFGLYDGNLAVGSSSSSSSLLKKEEDDNTKTDTSQANGNSSLANRDTASSSSSTNSVAVSKTTTPAAAPTTKRVFSNWGGEFFKKNLDYRANTNKILEKMNLNPSPLISGGGAAAGAANSSNGGSASSGGESTGGASGGFRSMSWSPTKRPLDGVGSHHLLSKFGSPPNSANSSSSDAGSPTAKKFKATGFFTSTSSS